MPGSDTFDFDKLPIIENRYKLERKIGSGGISTVYVAKDLVLKRELALKVLKPDKLKDEHLVRLHREAKAICQLKHSNIIDVYDFIITGDNVPVLAMELVNGRELFEIVQESGPLSQRKAVLIFLQLANALAYAHGRKILHRDLKPQNVLIENLEDESPRVKVFDFGIAKISDIDDDSITRSGFIVGTPAYISPEQAKNENVDARSDIYSLGCLMFFTLAGKPPFKGESMVETLNMQIKTRAPKLKDANPDKIYNEEIESLVAKCLMKSPEDRFQSMEELEQALKKIAYGEAATDDQELTPEAVSTVVASSKDESTRSDTGLKRLFEIAALIVLALLLISPALYFMFLSKQDSKPKNLKSAELRKLLRANGIIRIRKNAHIWYKVDGRLTDDQIKVLQRIKPVRLELAHASFDNQQLESLKDFPLIILDLRGTDITDEGIEKLRSIKTLRTLVLEDCQKIGHRGFKALSTLENLEVLSLRNTKVSDVDVEALLPLKEMKLLYISKSEAITDRAVDTVLKFEQLISLRIGSTSLTKAGIEKLQKHPNLSFLGLRDLSIDDEKMPSQFAEGLTMLDLSGNPFSDTSLKKIVYIPELWFLDVRGCPHLSELAVHALNTKLYYRQYKICLSDYIPEVAKIAMQTETEWYLEPNVYSNKSWNSMEFRKNLLSSDYLLEGKQFNPDQLQIEETPER
ncbi:MAG: protein kinase [Candidatus Obscuribacterales bacterium]|nr:protein kinase [Candidatus Obscuribacterales bacterium]